MATLENLAESRQQHKKFLHATVIAYTAQSHTHRQWLEFLKQIDREIPLSQQIHIILATLRSRSSSDRLVSRRRRRPTAAAAQCRELSGMPPCEPLAAHAAKDYHERCEELTGSSLRECPICHQGRMLVSEVLPRSPHRRMAIKDTS